MKPQSILTKAILREKQIKGWTRKKKEALLREDWDELKRLSKSSLEKARLDNDKNAP